MSKLKTRTRRKRRQARAVMKHGPSAKPRHMLKSGRTGAAHHKKTPSSQRSRPNEPADACCNSAPAGGEDAGITSKPTREAPASDVPCESCNGGGIKLYTRSRLNPYGEPCPTCRGTGKRSPGETP